MVYAGSNTINNSEQNDSVPTDLTVSLSGTSLADNSSVVEDVGKLRETIKSLKNESELCKLQLVQKNNLITKLQNELKCARESQNDKIKVLEIENNLLTKRLDEITGKTDENLQEKLRLENVNKNLQKQLSILEESNRQLSVKVEELSQKNEALKEKFNSGEFTVDNYEKIKSKNEDLQERLCIQDRKLGEALQTQETWRKKYDKLKSSYDKRLQKEIDKLRFSLRNHISLLRNVETENLERNYKNTVDENIKLNTRLQAYQTENESLRKSLNDTAESRDKWKKMSENLQISHSELMQKVSTMAVAKSRLETEIKVLREELSLETNDKTREVRSREDKIRQLENELERQTTALRDYENTILALNIPADDELASRLPPLLKTQLGQNSRFVKRVAELETENSLLKRQCGQMIEKIEILEKEMESRDSVLKSKSPDYVTIIRSKEAQIRELRTLNGKKDIQILELAKQVEQLKKLRNQLGADLEKLLQHRSEIDALKRICETRLL